MAPKKKKIIKKKITKADVKRIPKIQNVKPNISISPFDLANMVQQKFRQDMDADKVRIEKRQAELQAERKALQSPEIKQLMNDVARLNRMNQLQQRQNQGQQLQVELDAEASAIQSPETRERMVSVAQTERVVRLSKQRNDLMDQSEYETAKLEARRDDIKGELHAHELKRTKQASQKIAKAKAKAQVQTEQLDEQIKIKKEDVKNIEREAYVQELDTTGKENARELGRMRAKQLLETTRLKQAAEDAEKKQKALFEFETKAKQCEQLIGQYKEHIRILKEHDPNFQLTDDPALFEADLYVLGEKKEQYQQAVRELEQLRAFQRTAISYNNEVEELKKQLQDAPYGVSFSSLYGNNPSNIVRAVGSLVQVRQGRAALTDSIGEIFPEVVEVQKRTERRAEEIAKEREELEAQKTQFESDKLEMENRLRDASVVNTQLRQQLAAYEQQQPE